MSSIEIWLNGEAIYVEEGLSIDALLYRQRLPRQGVAVAQNETVVPRTEWTRPLVAGDRLEILTVAPGG